MYNIYTDVKFPPYSASTDPADNGHTVIYISHLSDNAPTDPADNEYSVIHISFLSDNAPTDPADNGYSVNDSDLYKPSF